MVPRRGLAARVHKSSKISSLTKTPCDYVYHSCVPLAMAKRNLKAMSESSLFYCSALALERKLCPPSLRGFRSEAGGVEPSLLALSWSAAHGAASFIFEAVWQRDDPRVPVALRRAAKLAAIDPPGEPGANNFHGCGFGSRPLRDHGCLSRPLSGCQDKQ
jgi:hypothetical protein